MKTENMMGSTFTNWFVLQKSVDWRDDRTLLDNTRRTFLEALRQGINKPRAFFEVANRIDQAGRTVDWRKLRELWSSVKAEWKALRKSKGILQLPAIPPVLNGHGAQKVAIAPTSNSTTGKPQHNGNHHQQPKPQQLRERGGASLVSYYL